MAGREARNERWAFAAFAYELRVIRGGGLSYLERYRLEPAQQAVTPRWVADGASYFATMLTCGASASTDLELAQRRLDEIEGVRAAVDRLESDLQVVRLVGVSGAAFHRARREAME
jgi:urease accessory protein UreH